MHDNEIAARVFKKCFNDLYENKNLEGVHINLIMTLLIIVSIMPKYFFSLWSNAQNLWIKVCMFITKIKFSLAYVSNSFNQYLLVTASYKNNYKYVYFLLCTNENNKHNTGGWFRGTVHK